MSSTSAPAFLQLYPTLLCNQRCVFCFNRDVGGSYPDLTFDNALRLIGICTERGIGEIDVMGGEPFLLPWIAEFAREAVSRGIRVNISTNGSRPDLVSRFSGISNSMLTPGVSIEGSSRKSHTTLTNSDFFQNALMTVKSFKTLGFDPVVKTVLNRATIDEAGLIIETIRPLGVENYYLIHMDILSNDEKTKNLALSYPEFIDHFRVIREAFRGISINHVAASCFAAAGLPSGARCAGGVRKLAVMPDGSVFPCNLMIHFPEFRLGNFFATPFDEIWNHPQLDLFRTAGAGCPEESCGNHHNCAGGCPAHNLYHTGRPDGIDIRCRHSSTRSAVQ